MFPSDMGVGGIRGGGGIDKFPNVGMPGAFPTFDDDMLFQALFDNVDAPLRLARGTGSFTFTRATTATYVHPTTGLITSAASGELRIESNGALIEGARTNLLTYSEQFDHANWVNYETTDSPDTAVAPDGTTTADTLIESSATDQHFIKQNFTSGGGSVISVYAKKKERDWIWMVLDNYYVTFDLTNGVVGTVGTPSKGTIIDVGNGWYRCSVLDDILGVGAKTAYIGVSSGDYFTSYAGDGTSGVYLWGAGVELGLFQSSYIPTVAAAVTRNADQLTMPNSGNLSATTGTVYLEMDATNYSRELYIFNSAGDRPIIGANSGGNLSYYDGTTAWGDVFNPTTWITTNKIANAYTGSSLYMGMNGVVSASQLFDGDWNIGTNSIIGTYNYGETDTIFGHIKNLRIWNRAFTDAEMQAITQ